MSWPRSPIRKSLPASPERRSLAPAAAPLSPPMTMSAPLPPLTVSAPPPRRRSVARTTVITHRVDQHLAEVAEQDVRLAAAVDGVVAGLAQHQVQAGAAEGEVVVVAEADLVVAGVAVGAVVAVSGQNEIVSAAGQHNVVAGMGLDAIVAVVPVAPPSRNSVSRSRWRSALLAATLKSGRQLLGASCHRQRQHRARQRQGPYSARHKG